MISNLSLHHVNAILTHLDGHSEDIDAVVVFDVLQHVIDAYKGSRSTDTGAVKLRKKGVKRSQNRRKRSKYMIVESSGIYDRTTFDDDVDDIMIRSTDEVIRIYIYIEK